MPLKTFVGDSHSVALAILAVMSSIRLVIRLTLISSAINSPSKTTITKDKIPTIIDNSMITVCISSMGIPFLWLIAYFYYTPHLLRRKLGYSSFMICTVCVMHANSFIIAHYAYVVNMLLSLSLKTPPIEQPPRTGDNCIIPLV